MNNQLLIEREKLRKELQVISYTERSLEEFLKKYELYFTEKESVEALKIINNYLINLKQKNDLLSEKLTTNIKMIKESCSHEVLMDSISLPNIYTCAICHKQIKKEKANSPCFIVERDNGINFYTEEHIIDAINKVITNNEDIFETFEDHIEDDEIRVYRRIK